MRRRLLTGWSTRGNGASCTPGAGTIPGVAKLVRTHVWGCGVGVLLLRVRGDSGLAGTAGGGVEVWPGSVPRHTPRLEAPRGLRAARGVRGQGRFREGLSGKRLPHLGRRTQTGPAAGWRPSPPPPGPGLRECGACQPAACRVGPPARSALPPAPRRPGAPSRPGRALHVSRAARGWGGGGAGGRAGRGGAGAGPERRRSGAGAGRGPEDGERGAAVPGERRGRGPAEPAAAAARAAAPPAPRALEPRPREAAAPGHRGGERAAPAAARRPAPAAGAPTPRPRPTAARGPSCRPRRGALRPPPGRPPRPRAWAALLGRPWSSGPALQSPRGSAHLPASVAPGRAPPQCRFPAFEAKQAPTWLFKSPPIPRGWNCARRHTLGSGEERHILIGATGRLRVRPFRSARGHSQGGLRRADGLQPGVCLLSLPLCSSSGRQP